MFRPNSMERSLLNMLKAIGVPGAAEIRGFFYTLHFRNPIISSAAETAGKVRLSIGQLLKACSHTVGPKKPPFQRLFTDDRRIQTLDVGGTYLFVDCALFALLFAAARQWEASGGIVGFTFPLIPIPITKMKSGPAKGGNTLLCLQRPQTPGRHSNNWMARHPDGDYMWLCPNGIMKMPLADAVRWAAWRRVPGEPTAAESDGREVGGAAVTEPSQRDNGASESTLNVHLASNGARPDMADSIKSFAAEGRREDGRGDRQFLAAAGGPETLLDLLHSSLPIDVRLTRLTHPM